MLKDRVLVKFPALVQAATGIMVTIANGVYTFALNFAGFVKVTGVTDTTKSGVLVYTPDSVDPTTGVYTFMAISDFIASASLKVQEVTTGTVPINTDSNVVLSNQAVPGLYTFTLPLSSTKSGPVKVVDWAADSGSNYITVTLTGADKFPGGGTSFIIQGNGASVVFTPVPGKGYVI